MRAPLTEVELAAGVALGRDRSRADEVRRLQGETVRTTPREAVMRAIERSTDPEDDLYVMFSGGLDSSLLLAAAREVRERQGGTPPIAVTTRYDAAGADETSFQELVMRFLDLDDWIILDAEHDLDLLSDEAKVDLVAHGLSASARVPGNGWFYRQIGGTGAIVTGEGGDEIFGPGPMTPLYFTLGALRRRRHVRRSLGWGLRQAARWAGPWPARAGVELPRWLTPVGRDVVTDGFEATYGGRPLTVRRAHQLYRSMRSNDLIAHDCATQATAVGLHYSEPFMDPQFMAELLSTLDDRQMVGRNALFRRCFSGWLPPELIDRTSKASFNAAVFSTHTRTFASQFTDFDCLPTELVRPDLVRNAWLSGDDARSGLMLQHAWLATR